MGHQAQVEDHTTSGRPTGLPQETTRGPARRQTQQPLRRRTVLKGGWVRLTSLLWSCVSHSEGMMCPLENRRVTRLSKNPLGSYVSPEVYGAFSILPKQITIVWMLTFRNREAGKGDAPAGAPISRRKTQKNFPSSLQRGIRSSFPRWLWNSPKVKRKKITGEGSVLPPFGDFLLRMPRS